MMDWSQPLRVPLILRLVRAAAWVLSWILLGASPCGAQVMVSPPGVGPAAGHFIALSDPGWEHREAAAAWLIAHPADWVVRVPESWQPADAEGRFQWQRVQRTLQELARFPVELGVLPWERAVARATSLVRRHPDAFRGAVERALQSPDARVRQRGIDLVGELPDLDLRVLSANLGPDASPWVRRSFYRVALAEDPAWAAGLLLEALDRPESSALRQEVARAARGLTAPGLRPRLRALWEEADPDLRVEIGLSLCPAGEPQDRAIFHWLLGTLDPELVAAGARALRRMPGPEDTNLLVALLPEAPAALRKLLLDLLSCTLAVADPQLVDSLRAHSDPDLAALALQHRGPAARVTHAASEGGELHPGVAHPGQACAVPAIEPARPPSTQPASPPKKGN